MLVIKTESLKVAEGVVLTQEAKKTMELFKCVSYIEEHTKGDISMCLCLKPWNEDDDLNSVFEEGRYDYHSTNPYFEDFKKILEELVDLARPITFTEEDVLATF